MMMCVDYTVQSVSFASVCVMFYLESTAMLVALWRGTNAQGCFELE